MHVSVSAEIAEAEYVIVIELKTQSLQTLGYYALEISYTSDNPNALRLPAHLPLC